MRIRRAVLLLVFTAGCGSDTSRTSTESANSAARPEGEPAPMLAACATLTKEDVSVIVGQPVSSDQTDTPGTWAEHAYTSICNYYGGSSALISFTITQPASPAEGPEGLAAELQKDNTSSGVPASPVEPIAAVGDAAAGYRLGAEAGGTQYVIAQKGAIRLGATAGAMAQARAMVEKGLTRLP